MTPPEDAVLERVAAGVATLTVNRPERRNALSPELVDGLYDALARAARSDDVRVVVLTNTPPTFCAGADLSNSDGAARQSFPALLQLILDSPKPVVARVDGDCFGGGVGLAAACDLVVARDDARFAFSEVRLGVAAAIISVVCLPKLRMADARRLLLTGERFDARHAADVGLITDAVPSLELDDRVDTYVSQILLGGPQALAATKRLLATVPALRRDEAFEWTTQLSNDLFNSPEASEGFAAFRERRPPSWSPAVRQ